MCLFNLHDNTIFMKVFMNCIFLYFFDFVLFFGGGEEHPMLCLLDLFAWLPCLTLLNYFFLSWLLTFLVVFLPLTKPSALRLKLCCKFCLHSWRSWVFFFWFSVECCPLILSAFVVVVSPIELLGLCFAFSFHRSRYVTQFLNSWHSFHLPGENVYSGHPHFCPPFFWHHL